jgi:SAM-dependent methyltransferase
MTNDQTIIDHYSQAGLGQTILTALNESGKSLQDLTPEDISPVDEFHIGGRAATAHLMTYLQFQPDMHILDVGCGIGGAARFLAETVKCRLTGIDLTPEYCNAAALLTQKTGLADYIIYKQGNALALPFENEAFDGAYTIHTAMNIADKATFYREIARTLQPGAFLGIYDVLRGDNPEAPDYPLPWSSDAGDSFLASLEETRKLLGDAGFEILVEDNESGFGLLSLKKLQDANPVFGPRIVMGEDYPAKISNLAKAIETRRCAPWFIICKKRIWEEKQR